MNKLELLGMLHELMDDAQRIKQESVSEAHEPQDLPPVLWYHGKRSNGTTLLVNACQLHDHTPPEILALTLPYMCREHGMPELLIMGTEGFMRLYGPDERAPIELRRGSMAEDFENNPASNVVETVLITACQTDLVGGSELVQVIAPFRYDDGLQIIWLERESFGVDTEEVEGAIPDVMRNAFATTEEEWIELAEGMREAAEKGQYQWPTFNEHRGHGGWANCVDDEVTEELVAIEQQGFDVTAAVKRLFAEDDPDFAEHIERADLVWDGSKAFGIGIKMNDPGYAPDPPDPADLMPRLIEMLREQKENFELERIPVKPGIFEAMRVFEFSQEIEETLGKGEGDDDDSGG